MNCVRLNLGLHQTVVTPKQERMRKKKERIDSFRVSVQENSIQPFLFSHCMIEMMLRKDVVKLKMDQACRGKLAPIHECAWMGCDVATIFSSPVTAIQYTHSDDRHAKLATSQNNSLSMSLFKDNLF